MPTSTPNHILGLDVGSQRIGVAIAHADARLPRPLLTLDATTDVIAQLEALIHTEAVSTLVVGLPRGLDGHETAQTQAVRTFVDTLAPLGLAVYLQDEALTSRKAEAELEARGKAYNKADVDALAATYILEDFLATHPKEDSA
jgi:putative Holliday junction resolvase